MCACCGQLKEFPYSYLCMQCRTCGCWVANPIDSITSGFVRGDDAFIIRSAKALIFQHHPESQETEPPSL